MIIVRGESVELPEEEREKLKNQTNPTWPHMYVKLRTSYEEFLTYFPANHIHGIPGNYVEELVHFCRIAGIKPIVLGEDKHKFLEPLWDKV